MHLNSKLIFEKYAVKYFKENQTVLEIGPAGYPSYYCKSVNKPSIKWHTLDIGTNFIEEGERNPLHILSADEYKYPIEDETFDVVVSGQVIEHVQKIWKWMDELKRITKKGGLIIIVSPISWKYHEAPIDCWRIYPEGMKGLMDDKNLEIKECLFESLEIELLSKNAKTIRGESTIGLDGKLPGKYKFLQFCHGIPVLGKFFRKISVAYDNVCICQK